MLQNSRPHRVQGLNPDPSTSPVLQDKSCAPTHASQERGIYAAELPTGVDPSVQPPRIHAHLCCRPVDCIRIQGIALDPVDLRLLKSCATLRVTWPFPARRIPHLRDGAKQRAVLVALADPKQW